MKIIIADDHALIREGVKSTLRNLSADIPVIFEAENADEVPWLVHNNPGLDVVLLDLFMPGMDTFELLSIIRDRNPDLPVVVLSDAKDLTYIRKSLDSGARGYIHKSTPSHIFLSALRLVLSGGTYIPPDVFDIKPEHIQPNNDVLTIAGVTPEKYLCITDRQAAVLTLLGEGLPNKVIARKLGLSEHTIKIHVTSILKTLGAANRTQAVIAAQRLSLVH